MTRLALNENSGAGVRHRGGVKGRE